MHAPDDFYVATVLFNSKFRDSIESENDIFKIIWLPDDKGARILNQEDYQGHSVVNYTVSEDFTRITEFKYLTGQKDTNGTTIIREYPFAYTGAPGEIPYYAILNPENRKLYEKYTKMAEQLPNLHLLGRLAEYQYYNIDAMTKKALELAGKLLAG